jgi:glycine cleavage system H lipoate-binding protein
MACPFLREVQVKYCRTSAVRKLIPLAQGAAAEGRCATADHARCKAFQLEPGASSEGASDGPCPYLTESLMQYCGAAPVTKFVPFSEASLSRCGRQSFRYCELYLAMAHPELPESVEGIEAPSWLRYSANHMWLDVTDDHVCHAGIDAFLGRALGKIDSLAYVWLSGRRRPAAVLTVAGMDLEVVFPNPLLLTGCNLHLRANPSRIVTEPYTGGWLFEGTALPETLAGLREGISAQSWMEQEQGRMNEYLQQQTCAGQACDGGLFAAGLPRHLDRSQWQACYHEFFSPDVNDKGEPQ